MSIGDTLSIIFFVLIAFLLAENVRLSEQNGQERNDQQLKIAYDDGYDMGYSQAMEDTETYETSVEISNQLITDDQLENPHLYQIDTTNSFK